MPASRPSSRTERLERFARAAQNRPAPRSRDTARAQSRTAAISSGRSSPSWHTRSTAPVMPTAPTGIRRRLWMGAATEATPVQVSSTSSAYPRARVRSRTPSNSLQLADRPGGERLALGLQDLAVRHRVVGRQHLAQGRGVQRLHGPDLQHLPAVVGPEDVVHDQHALLVQHAQIDALAAGAGQVVGPHQGARPQLVHVEIGGAQAQQLGAQLIAPGGRRPARRSPPAGGCAVCRGRCPWPGPARRRCPTGRAVARRPRAAAASRPPVRATGCSVPSPCCLRPLGPRRATPLPPFGNVEHYRSMPTSRQWVVARRLVGLTPRRHPRTHPSVPWTPTTIVTASGLPWRRAPSMGRRKADSRRTPGSTFMASLPNRPFRPTAADPSRRTP